VSLYLVTGRLRYREHSPGETFIADLDRDVEERAVKVGAIRVVERAVTRLDPDRATPPRDWHDERAH
jgi:hypothetical protein